jgi:hypothetical protein
MEIYSNSDFDGTSHADMVELGQNPHQSGGAYYSALMSQQLAQNRLLQQVKKEGEPDAPLTSTWDSQQPTETTLNHHRAYEIKAAGPETQVKKPKRAEPTVRLRKAMGLPLRQGEPLFDDKFKKGLPIK